MIRVLALRLFVKTWKKAITISDKLPTRIWNIVALASLFFLIFSIIGLLYSESSNEVTDKSHNEAPDHISYPTEVLLNTKSPTIGNNFNSQQITQLPLESRNVIDLLTLQPGVTSTANGGASRSIPDKSKWNYEIGSNGWGNNELETYTSRTENAFLDGEGYLIIKTPFGEGVYPAFWMLGSNSDSVRWPICGEVDIMESVGMKSGMQSPASEPIKIEITDSKLPIRHALFGISLSGSYRTLRDSTNLYVLMRVTDVADTPTISKYSWSTTPTVGQNVTITGTNFISGGTQVFFCVNGVCYQQPAAEVTVNSSTSLTVSNEKLGSGVYQIYVHASDGQGAQLTTSTVPVPPQPDTKVPPLHDFQFWIKVVNILVATLNLLWTAFLAWISNYPSRAQRMVKEAEAKLRLKQIELETLKVEQELARLRSSPIILTD